MKSNIFLIILFFGITASLSAQNKVSDCLTTGNEDYCIINLSRTETYQEIRAARKSVIQLYINSQPVCEISCPGRASIKVFSEGKLTIGLKFLPYGKMTQKQMDKVYLYKEPTELNVEHGKTYFTNVDIKLHDAFTINFTGSIVSIPESEAMFRDEIRFEKRPEISFSQEDTNNPFIRN